MLHGLITFPPDKHSALNAAKPTGSSPMEIVSGVVPCGTPSNVTSAPFGLDSMCISGISIASDYIDKRVSREKGEKSPRSICVQRDSPVSVDAAQVLAPSSRDLLSARSHMRYGLPSEPTVPTFELSPVQ